MINKIKSILIKSIKYFILFAIVINIISYYKSLDLNKNKLDINKFKLINDLVYEVPKNKPLLIHFWATWCPTCKFESKNIEKISKDYEVITIAVQSGSKEDILKYLQKHDLTFKVVNDKDSFYSNKFNIKAFPTTLIYNRNRDLKFSEVGYTTTVGLYSRMKLSEK